MQLDQALVEDHADAGLAVAERDDPDPITEAHVVIGGQAPRADVARAERAVARGEIVDVADVLPAAPDGGDGMVVVAVDDAEAPAEKGGLAGRVEEPFTRHPEPRRRR